MEPILPATEWGKFQKEVYEVTRRGLWGRNVEFAPTIGKRRPDTIVRDRKPVIIANSTIKYHLDDLQKRLEAVIDIGKTLKLKSEDIISFIIVKEHYEGQKILRLQQTPFFAYIVSMEAYEVLLDWVNSWGDDDRILKVLEWIIGISGEVERLFQPNEYAPKWKSDPVKAYSEVLDLILRMCPVCLIDHEIDWSPDSVWCSAYEWGGPLQEEDCNTYYADGAGMCKYCQGESMKGLFKCEVWTSADDTCAIGLAFDEDKKYVAVDFSPINGDKETAEFVSKLLGQLGIKSKVEKLDKYVISEISEPGENHY